MRVIAGGRVVRGVAESGETILGVEVDQGVEVGKAGETGEVGVSLKTGVQVEDA